MRRISSRAFTDHIDVELSAIRSVGTYKSERVITTPQSNLIHISSRGEEPLLNFCANNYLGLSNDARLNEAAIDAIRTRGNGLSSVRFICGTSDIHKTLERRIADFHSMDDAILYASCFDANGGLFETLFGSDDAIISDELNHASLIDGIRLCKAARHRYRHLDMADLKSALTKSASARHRVIVTDGVFSMDGHIAPLDAIVSLAEEHDALVMIDDCHATGFLGRTGRGTAEYCDVVGRVDIINSTLGKAMGGAIGGYTTASRRVIDLLRQRSRPYLFSNTLPPAVVGASIACYDMISSDTTLRDRLEANTKLFRGLMADARFDLGGSQSHPIVPIMLGDARLAADFAENMLDEGVYVVGFSYPVVPKGTARIRTQISAGHSEDDIRRAVAAFEKVRNKLVR